MTSESAEQYEYIIVGAGPAGLQMGYYLAAANRNYVILEAAGDVGSFFDTFPRHRSLLSINKRYNYFPEPEFNMRHDWNSLLSDDSGPRFPDYSDDLFPDRDELRRYLHDYAAHFDLRVRFSCRIVRIEPEPDRGFTLTDGDGNTYRCRYLFLATGAREPWIPPDIDGIETVPGYEDHSLDPADYTNKRVAIIGRGNSAFEVANHIAGHASIVHVFVKQQVRHSWQTHYAGDLRAVNNNILDMYQLKSLHATMAFVIKTIRKNPAGGYELTLETEFRHWDPPRLHRAEFSYDEVIRCTGWRYADRALFADGTAPDVDDRGKFFVLSPNWETSVPNLYCIGTTMQYRDHKAASSFIHGFRYNIRSLVRLLEEKNHGVPYPHETFPLQDDGDVSGVADFLVERVSVSAGLYQQFGVLCDVMDIGRDSIRYLYELPFEGVLERDDLQAAENIVVITLEYGFDQYLPTLHPLDFVLPPDFGTPGCSAFLHPVLRHYRNGEFVEELHLNENLVLRFDFHYDNTLPPDAHQSRVKNFLARILGVGGVEYNEEIYRSDIPAELLLTLSPDEIEARSRQRAAGARCTFVLPDSVTGARDRDVPADYEQR
ncbi:NAD(P)-binding domain-containing protein [Nocardia sp. NPDC051787]|uniref:NAD(P)-binding domain-containing protein n=1 Tax=Nocardia sp. NPDC051787 TaxID=3155415 RepID=UPI0034134641